MRFTVTHIKHAEFTLKLFYHFVARDMLIRVHRPTVLPVWHSGGVYHQIVVIKW